MSPSDLAAAVARVAAQTNEFFERTARLTGDGTGEESLITQVRWLDEARRQFEQNRIILEGLPGLGRLRALQQKLQWQIPAMERLTGDLPVVVRRAHA